MSVLEVMDMKETNKGTNWFCLSFLCWKYFVDHFWLQHLNQFLLVSFWFWVNIEQKQSMIKGISAMTIIIFCIIKITLSNAIIRNLVLSFKVYIRRLRYLWSEDDVIVMFSFQRPVHHTTGLNLSRNLNL